MFYTTFILALFLIFSLAIHIFLCRLPLGFTGLIVPAFFFIDAFMNALTYVVYRSNGSASFLDGLLLFLRNVIPAVIFFLIYLYIKKKKTKAGDNPKV